MLLGVEEDAERVARGKGVVKEVVASFLGHVWVGLEGFLVGEPAEGEGRGQPRGREMRKGASLVVGQFRLREEALDETEAEQIKLSRARRLENPNQQAISVKDAFSCMRK